MILVGKLSQSIPESQIEILIPQLRKVAQQLVEYEPSHIRLLVRPTSEDVRPIGIDIDLELWLSLMKIKRGLLNRYQDPVIVRRLTTFMSRLSAQIDINNKGYATIHVLDAEKGSVNQINVSYDEEQKGKYIW